MNTRKPIFDGRDLIPMESSSFLRLFPKSVNDVEYLGKETIRQLVREWRWKANKLSNEVKALDGAQSFAQIECCKTLLLQKRGVDARIKALLELERKAESKPILGFARPNNWADVGDPLICYVTSHNGFVPVREGFMRGIVKQFYEIVVVAFPERLHAHPLLEGHGVNFFDWEAKIMRVSEYQYLVTHPDFARTWVEYSYFRNAEPGHPRYLDRERFLRDLAVAESDI
jgi:hypothetical protein